MCYIEKMKIVNTATLLQKIKLRDAKIAELEAELKWFKNDVPSFITQSTFLAAPKPAKKS